MSTAAATLPLDRAVADSGQHDFDFLFGRWQVRNRRLRERLAACTTWDEFDARARCEPVLGGAGNLERFDSDWNGGLHGLALRLFDPATQRWSIHWASAGTAVLEPAVVGRFVAGVGDFYGPEQHHGRTVLSRYRWSSIIVERGRAQRATWEQAWSTDAGATWETNWVMQFSRIDDAPAGAAA